MSSVTFLTGQGFDEFYQSFERRMARTSSDTAQLKLISEYGERSLKFYTDSTILFTSLGKAKSLETNNFQYHNEYLTQEARSYALLGKYEIADSVLNICLNEASARRDTFWMINATNLKGWIKSWQNLYVLAANYHEDAARLSLHSKNDFKLSGTYNRLCVLNARTRNHREAIKYSQNIIDIYSETGIKQYLKSAYGHLSEAYLSLDNIDSARYYLSFLEDSSSVVFQSGQSRANYINCLISIKEDDLSKAEYFFNAFRSNKKRNSEIFFLIRLSLEMGEMYLKNNKYDELKSVLDDIQAPMSRREIIEYDLKYNHLYTNYYLLKGDVSQAKIHLDNWKEFSQKNQELVDVNTQISQELLINERNLEKQLVLADQKANLDQKRIRQQVYFSSILFFLLALMGYFIYRYRMQSKVNKRLVTEISDKNQFLENTVDEKEFLMKEIHHRVKNNLQTISSLINLQADHLSDDQLMDILSSSSHRIRSIALIHQFLYEKDHLDSVDISKYIETLVLNLLDSFSLNNGRIVPRFDIQPLRINISTMNSLGLLINELVVNVIKYAFPGNMRGELYVHMQQEEGNLRLIVRDNGIGLPENFDLDDDSNFGYFLVRSLAQKLKADLSIRGTDGTEVNLLIKKYKMHSYE